MSADLTARIERLRTELAALERVAASPPDDAFAIDAALRGLIREQRRYAGFSQRKLAEAMSAMGHEYWHTTTVSRIENGGQGLLVTELVSLAYVLGTTPADLLDAARGRAGWEARTW